MFIPQEGLDSLVINRSVFHVVGPHDSDYTALAEFDVGKHAEFFLGRVRPINTGNVYRFTFQTSERRSQIRQLIDSPEAFQETSEKLARAFQDEHAGKGNAAIGAFLILVLGSAVGNYVALLKFEDEKVLAYNYSASNSQRPTPQFGELLRTFVQNRNALQKAALVSFGADGGGEGEVCLVDRMNPSQPAAYFESFLTVTRNRSSLDLTKALVKATRAAIEGHPDLLSVGARRGLSQRLYEASQMKISVDAEHIENWLGLVAGPQPADSPLVGVLRSELRKARILGESFDLDATAVPKPRYRRILTQSGVQLRYPSDLGEGIVTVDEKNGVITIRDPLQDNDVEFDSDRRTRT